MPQSFAAVDLHVIFSTKERRPEIDPVWRSKLFDYMAGTAKTAGCPIRVSGGVADHVHLLVSMSRTVTIADFVRDIKSSSSRWIHDSFAGSKSFAWQSGYGAFSVSPSVRPTVVSYIEHQEEHHHQTTFQDEFREFLRKHGCEWDERYVWD